MANILDVARLAGVSPTTAKRAIRDPDRLAPATLERVLKAIETLQYEPDQVASALRRGHSNTIGLIIGSIVEPFFADITRAIGPRLREHGYSVIVADNEYRSDLELAHLRALSGNRIAGLIIRSGYGQSNLDYLARLNRRGVAIVELDYFAPGSPYSHVMLDNPGAVTAGVDHLVAYGHERIAALGKYSDLNRDERVQTFPQAMAAHGLRVRPEYALPAAPVESDAFELTRKLMALREPPTALFALTGTMATGAYRALRAAGLRVPEDVSLLGFDNYPWMELLTPAIDTLAQPVDKMGEESVRILFRLMREGEDAHVERVRLPAELIERGSVIRAG